MKKFQNAFSGLLLGCRDHGIRIQYLLGACALAAAVLLKLDAMEWIVVILSAAFVITSEILNTCIEKICDYCTEEYDERIRVIKDLASGAVLVSALAALASALIILKNHL